MMCFTEENKRFSELKNKFLNKKYREYKKIRDSGMKPISYGCFDKLFDLTYEAEKIGEDIRRIFAIHDNLKRAIRI